MKSVTLAILLISSVVCSRSRASSSGNSGSPSNTSPSTSTTSACPLPTTANIKLLSNNFESLNSLLLNNSQYLNKVLTISDYRRYLSSIAEKNSLSGITALASTAGAKYTTLSGDSSMRTIIGPCKTDMLLPTGAVFSSNYLLPNDLCTTYIPITSSSTTSCTPTTTMTLAFDLPSGVVPKCDVSVTKLCTPTTTVTIPTQLPSGLSVPCFVKIVTGSLSSSSTLCTPSTTVTIPMSLPTGISAPCGVSLVVESSSSVCTPTSTITIPQNLPDGISTPCGLSVVIASSSSSTSTSTTTEAPSSVAITTFNIPTMSTMVTSVVIPVLRTTNHAVTPILACVMPTPKASSCDKSVVRLKMMAAMGKDMVKDKKSGKKSLKKISKKGKKRGKKHSKGGKRQGSKKSKGSDDESENGSNSENESFSKGNKRKSNRKGKMDRDSRRGSNKTNRGDQKKSCQMDRGKGRMNGGQDRMNGGKGRMNGGQDRMSGGKGRMNGGQGLMKGGNGRMDGGQGLMNSGNGRMKSGTIQGNGRMKRGTIQGNVRMNGGMIQDNSRMNGGTIQGNGRMNQGNGFMNRDPLNSSADGNGLKYSNRNQNQMNRPNHPPAHQPFIYTTSAICPFSAARPTGHFGNSRRDMNKFNGKSKSGSRMRSAIAKKASIVTKSLPASTVTATEVLAFANFRTRTVTTHEIEPVTVTATQINAYEILKTQIKKLFVTRTDVETKRVTERVTDIEPTSIYLTSHIKIKVPTIQIVSHDNYHTVTVKEPVFRTVTHTPPPETRISISAIVEKVTMTETMTAAPVEVFESVTVVQF